MIVVWEKSVQKTLRKMPQKLAALIVKKVIAFADNPRTVHADIKPLAGTENSFRLRQGDWRVIMEVTQDKVIVETIGTRGDVYK